MTAYEGGGEQKVERRIFDIIRIDNGQVALSIAANGLEGDKLVALVIEEKEDSKKGWISGRIPSTETDKQMTVVADLSRLPEGYIIIDRAKKAAKP